MDVYKIKQVKSSNGTIEERIFIKTKLEIYGKTYETEISLTDRASMTYPMLIGRKLLKNRFIVDSSRVYLSSKEKKEK